jgi:hypothetical protein
MGVFGGFGHAAAKKERHDAGFYLQPMPSGKAEGIGGAVRLLLQRQFIA